MVRFGREKVVLALPFLIYKRRGSIEPRPLYIMPIAVQRGLLTYYLFASNKAAALDQLITLKNALT